LNHNINQLDLLKTMKIHLKFGKRRKIYRISHGSLLFQEHHKHFKYTWK
jgi:hypothetical protein